MFKMIEVVGSSGKSYSDAVKSVVEKFGKKERVHFFEVIEQRGAVRQGKIEYQVKVKIAVE